MGKLSIFHADDQQKDLVTGLAGDKGTPPVIVYVSAKTGLPDSETTWAKHLQKNGYVTQAVGKNLQKILEDFIYNLCLGKWHLGWDKSSIRDNLHGPLNHGFDNFFGIPFTLVEGFERSEPFFTYSKFAVLQNFFQ